MSLNSIFLDSFYSLVRVMVASVLAFLISLVIGSALHRHRRYYILFLPFINFIRQISPFVWMPFAIIFVGLGELPIAVVLFTAMVFPGIIMIYEVIDSFPDDLYEEALTAGANEKEIFLSIKIPMLRNQFINVFRFQWSMG